MSVFDKIFSKIYNPKKLRKMKEYFANRRLLFTDNRHPTRGIMSTILGALSMAALIRVIMLTFENGGQALAVYATVLIVSAVFCVTGLVLGIISRTERDIFKLFPNLGIILNALAILSICCIIYLGFWT